MCHDCRAVLSIQALRSKEGLMVIYQCPIGCVRFVESVSFFVGRGRGIVGIGLNLRIWNSFIGFLGSLATLIPGGQQRRSLPSLMWCGREGHWPL